MARREIGLALLSPSHASSGVERRYAGSHQILVCGEHPEIPPNYDGVRNN